jgi:F-type H+-transporting ATPase subunit gamma
MAGLRDIRQKIKGVSTTQQITGAMKMMSTARLGKAVEAIALTQAYIAKMEQMVQNLKRELPDYQHPCFTPRPVKTSCYIVIGGERGLCGGFNHELNRFALKTTSECKNNMRLIVVGKKAIRFFEQKNIAIHAAYPDLTFKSIDPELFLLAENVFKMFNSGEIDEINIIYTSFASAVKKFLTVSRLIPIDTTSIIDSKGHNRKLSFDFYPSPAAIFDQLVPRYLKSLLHRAMVESTAAEQSARMTAMTSATDRAEEIIDDLKLDLNRSRQALITRELSEVIAGSQAQV